ncbi:hypothetical protein K402DRAFT_394306 [Aulographum hederae CBS 113979]|uniref:Tc1-like transposase DDE domain-containing protein n=1 Tax=Aulographum hederae CBS 113979 TaxID=1176131 RepID=A0A6G1GZ38_9PEZI|nr:hypothetical protein K402DRAFT_394306 [Aulographum hederae CBS 113979]
MEGQERQINVHKESGLNVTLHVAAGVYKDSQPREEPIPKGNFMTQVLHTEKILTLHIKKIEMLEARYKHRFRLQEDGDSSHGHRSKNNPAAHLKRAADLLIHIHPAQSPDLNTIEASLPAQFKADILSEWDKITIAQIRRRIRKMPDRCLKAQASGGERIKSTLW